MAPDQIDVPYLDMASWPPGLLAPNHQALTDAMFCHHCDPLVVLSLDVMCIQVVTC